MIRLQTFFPALVLALFLLIPAKPAEATGGVLDKAREIPPTNYLSRNAVSVCIERARLNARQQNADFDAAEAEKRCRGLHAPGTETDEALDDLYQICRLRPTYQKFQKCMIDATGALEKK